MRCPIETPEHAARLLAYCTRGVDRETAAELEEHIRICSACREFVTAQKAVMEALDNWEAPPVPADFDRRLYRRIEQEVSWWHRLMRPFRPLLVRQGLPIAAAAALLMVAGFLVERPATVAPSTGPQSAQVDSASPAQLQRALDDVELLRELNHLVRTDGGESKM